jgi:hypothetical protein
MSYGQEIRGHEWLQESISDAFRRLNLQAQKSVAGLLLSVNGGEKEVAQVLKDATRDAKFVNQWISKSARGADFLVEAIKKALKNPDFALFVHDALDDDKAKLYGLKYDFEEQKIRFTAKNTSNRTSSSVANKVHFKGL